MAKPLHKKNGAHAVKHGIYVGYCCWGYHQSLFCFLNLLLHTPSLQPKKMAGKKEPLIEEMRAILGPMDCPEDLQDDLCLCRFLRGFQRWTFLDLEQKHHRFDKQSVGQTGHYGIGKYDHEMHLLSSGDGVASV